MNETFLDKFSDKMIPIADKLNRNRYLAAIRDGFFSCMSVIIIGSIFLLFSNFPSDTYLDFMAKTFGPNWTDFFNRAFNMSVNMMSLFVIVGIARSLAKYYKIDAISSVVTSLVGFLILTPIVKDATEADAIPMGNFGAAGLFLAMFSTIFAVEITRLVLARGWKIKMPDTVPENVSKSFEALVPALFVILIYSFIFLGFKQTGYQSAQGFVFQVIQAPLKTLGSTLPATLIFQLLATLLFAFGLHGPNIVGSVASPIWKVLTVENSEAYRDHLPLPNIVTEQFDANFVKIGGCGTTIGLAILFLFFAKSQQYKALGKLAIAPAIFNINEPLIFGAPIVLNPVLMIPFIVSPLIFGTLTYLVMKVGLVPYSNGVQIPWTTPPIMSGFLISGWQGAVWQVVEIFISIAWYFPFFRIADKQAFEVEQGQVKA